MINCHPISTPLELNMKLSKSQSPQTDEEKHEMSHVPYTNDVGTITYASYVTRPKTPNLAYVVGEVS